MKSMSNPYGWSLAKKIGQYYAWSRMPYNSKTLIWNLTLHDSPPSTGAGYKSLEAIKQLKDIK